METPLDTPERHDIVGAEMNTQGSRPRDIASTTRLSNGKRAYQQPMVRDYGSVASLTAGLGGSGGDGGTVAMMTMESGGGM